jgi:hypothetical protein
MGFNLLSGALNEVIQEQNCDMRKVWHSEHFGVTTSMVNVIS